MNPVPHPVTAEVFKQWCQDHGFGIIAAAHVLGVSRQTIMSWSNGKHPIHTTTHVMMCGTSAIADMLAMGHWDEFVRDFGFKSYLDLKRRMDEAKTMNRLRGRPKKQNNVQRH